jgi:hypothetical protein
MNRCIHENPKDEVCERPNEAVNLPQIGKCFHREEEPCPEFETED